MTMQNSAVSNFDPTQLISLVAHELRSPLMPIRHAAAMLKDVAPDPVTVRRAAEIIEREAEGMSRLIGDLVDVSRTQSGALELQRRRAPLSELMERAIESAGPFVREHGHQLTLSVSPEPIYLHMDVIRLRQALCHIIANACKYTDMHGHIHVRAQRSGTNVSIVVSDTGIGIRNSALEASFGLFARAGQGSHVQVGLGVGLYLARYFVEAHGGTLTAASAGTNRGSEFTIGLPCESSTAMVPAAEDEEPAVDQSRA